MEDDIVINGKPLGVSFNSTEEWPDLLPAKDRCNAEEFKKEFVCNWDKATGKDCTVISRVDKDGFITRELIDL